MIKNIILPALGLILLGLAFQAPQAKAQNANGPIVVELFTSQGCSSCPPADQIMNQLAENPDFIALSYHVTYWDHLRWKDTLGRAFADTRQKSYSKFKRSSRIYTPQMVINGEKEFVGSRKHEANTNLSNAAPISKISMSGLTPQGTIISLPQTRIGSYTIWVAGVKAQTEENIGRGENRGKMVTYSNTVLTLKQGEKWNGQAKTMLLDLPKTNDIDHYVILAQDRGYGRIMAAGKIPAQIN